jgi:hypothetical protein
MLFTLRGEVNRSIGIDPPVNRDRRGSLTPDARPLPEIPPTGDPSSAPACPLRSADLAPRQGCHAGLKE